MNSKFKWTWIGVAVLVALVMTAGYAAVASAQGPTPTPPAPYTNPWGYGGMMGGWWGGSAPTQGYTSTVPYGYRGWGMGPGMMGGMMGGSGWGGYGYAPNANPISLDQAVSSAKQSLASFNNSDLALVEVMEFSNQFYGEVKEKSTGIHAFEFLVDKYTGAVSPEYGPNMMWNTKYSPMGWMRGGFWFSASPAQNSVTPAQAKQNAQQFLDSYLPGTTVADEVDAFYGYYTIHTLRDGKIVGMLSVNGSTGAVWYHTWHGTFVQMKELD
jgi:hypothetical protein